MLRRLVAVSAAVLTVTFALPADAGSAKLFLNQQNADCGAGAVFDITNSPDDAGGCVIVPRLLVDGQGLANTNEAFATSKKLKTFRIDASKKLTGTFGLAGGARAAQGAAQVAGDFTVKVGGTKVGTVRVEGVATPAGPATKAFSLTIPRSLNRVRTNKVSVTVDWVTCVGLCGVAVSGASFLTVPTR